MERCWQSSPIESWCHADPPVTVALSGDGADQPYLAAWGSGTHVPPCAATVNAPGSEEQHTGAGGCCTGDLLPMGPASPVELCAPSSLPLCPLQLVLCPTGQSSTFSLPRTPLSQPRSRLAAHPREKVPTGRGSVRPVMSVQAWPCGLGSAQAMLFVFAGSGLHLALVPRGGDGGRDGHGAVGRALLSHTG